MGIDRSGNCNDTNKGISVPVEKKVVDVGPIQINKTENKWIGWPTYAGGIIAVIGVVLVVSGKKK